MSFICWNACQLPEDSAEESHDATEVGLLGHDAAEQYAECFVVGLALTAGCVVDLIHGFGDEGGEALELRGVGLGAGGGGQGWAEGAVEGTGLGIGVAGDFVEADSDGLAEVHGGLGVGGVDGDEAVAEGEVLGGEAVFFAANEDGGGWGVGGVWLGEGVAEPVCAEGKGEDGEGGSAFVERAGSEDEGAGGEGVGEGIIDLSVAEEVWCPDGGLGLAPVDGKGGDDGEVAEAEVGHGAGSSADVERVAWGDEDDEEAVGLGDG